MKPTDKPNQNPETDHSDEGESTEESLSNFMAFLKNPNAKDTFLTIAKEEPRDLLLSASLIENEPWAEEVLCDAAEIEPDFALEISPEITLDSLRKKLIAKAREVLKKNFRMV
jgi:hypothetical protein